MNKIDFGNVLMQRPPAQNDHKAVAVTVKHETKDKFQSIFKNIEQKEDIVSSENNVVNSDNQYEENSVLHEMTLDDKSAALTNMEDVSETANPFDSSEQLIEELRLISTDEKQVAKENDASSSLALTNIELNDMVDNEEEVVNDELSNEFLAQLHVVLQQLASLMNKGEHEEDFVQIAKAVHKLLQLWGRLPQQLQQSLKENEFLLENAEEESDVLRELISLFEKRNAFAKQQMYQTNSTITQDDIQKWLQQSLSKHAFIDAERTNVNVDTSQNQPLQMSTMQQYTLHVTESERVDAISRNLVSDLSNIVNKSQFLRQPGLDELTLTLRPNSLGDVTIRLSQINGEMTVRFLVTTQVARELFESNLHQLKPMFAPNNVVIERDSGISDEEFYQEEQEQLEEEQQNEQEQQASHDETSQHDVSFDELLQFLSEEANI